MIIEQKRLYKQSTRDNGRAVSPKQTKKNSTLRSEKKRTARTGPFNSKLRDFKTKKPLVKKTPKAIIHFFKTETNAICTLTDLSGNPKAWVSAGSLGIRGSRKSTVYASEAVARALAEKTLHLGFRSIVVKVKGIGFAKTRAVKTLKKEGLHITHIYDVTPTPHNGCRRPRKQRK